MSVHRTSFTTFTTSGGNVHVHTRTVIDDDGSVRREMRFQTPGNNASVNSNSNSGPAASTSGVSAAPNTSTTPKQNGQWDFRCKKNDNFSRIFFFSLACNLISLGKEHSQMENYLRGGRFLCKMPISAHSLSASREICIKGFRI